MSAEIELKLSLPPTAVARLRRHPLFAQAPKAAPTRTLINTYFDTPDLHLRGQRVALRIRKQGRDWLQTVKGGGQLAGGLAQRPEWEYPYRGDFVFEPVSALPVRALLEELRPSLTAIFSTNFRRETRQYSPKPGTTILMMLDQGMVEAQGRQAPLCELELELVEGPISALFDLALTLAQDVPLLPDDVSKAQRGYRLFLNETPSPTRATNPPIADSDPPLVAFRRLALAGLVHWQANIGGALAGGDPEYVHQVRIALRRLRSLLRLMAPALPPEWGAHWNTRLGAAAATLSGTRNLDVLVAELLPAVPRDPYAPVTSLAALQAFAERAQTAQHVTRRGDLDRAAQGCLLLGFSAALHALPATAEDHGDGLPELAVRALTRLRKLTRRRLESVEAHASPEALHALRIALKRLRYGFEFFHPLLARPKAMGRFIASLARMQDELGYCQDVAQSLQILQAWSSRHRRLAEGAAYVAGWHGSQANRVARRLPPRLASLLDSGEARAQARRS